VKRTALLLAALLSCACATAPAATVHLRGPDGTWIELEAEEQDCVVSFAITPDQCEGGHALVVINRPDWMVLDDEEPPRVTEYRLGGETHSLQPGEALALGGIGGDATALTFTVSDGDNPVDVGSLRLQVAGGAAPSFEVIEEDRQSRAATIQVDLGELGPGAYEGALAVADLSPLANTAEIPLRFSIAGAQVSPDGQTVRLSGGGAGFTCRGDRRETVAVDAAGISAFLTVQMGGPYLYVREFRNVEDLGEQGGWHVVEAEAALEDIDGNAVTDEEVGVRLTYRFAVHRDLPVLMVTSVATNLGDAREVYSFWGWLPGGSYVTPDGEAHEWLMEYEDFGHPGWVYILPRNEGTPGIGWISDLLFGESRFGTMLLYTDPKHIDTPAGESVEMTFAIMPADSAEEVAEAAEKLRTAGATPAPQPPEAPEQ